MWLMLRKGRSRVSWWICQNWVLQNSASSLTTIKQLIGKRKRPGSWCWNQHWLPGRFARVNICFNWSLFLQPHQTSSAGARTYLKISLMAETNSCKTNFRLPYAINKNGKTNNKADSKDQWFDNQSMNATITIQAITTQVSCRVSLSAFSDCQYRFNIAASPPFLLNYIIRGDGAFSFPGCFAIIKENEFFRRNYHGKLYLLRPY